MLKIGTRITQIRQIHADSVLVKRTLNTHEFVILNGAWLVFQPCEVKPALSRSKGIPDSKQFKCLRW